jgi:hypothetical protein
VLSGYKPFERKARTEAGICALAEACRVVMDHAAQHIVAKFKQFDKDHSLLTSHLLFELGCFLAPGQ